MNTGSLALDAEALYLELRRGVQTLLTEMGAKQRWEAAAAQANLSPEELLRRCAGRDASLVVLSELHPKAKITTTDVRDFTVYRRFRNEALPLIHP